MVSNGRVALENLIKYGILISPLTWVSYAPLTPADWPNLTIMMATNLSILLALLAEKLIAAGWAGNRFAAAFYTLLLLAHFILPAWASLSIQSNPLFCSWALSLVVVEGLKLVSWGHVNYWCREALKENKAVGFRAGFLKFSLI